MDFLLSLLSHEITFNILFSDSNHSSHNWIIRFPMLIFFKPFFSPSLTFWNICSSDSRNSRSRVKLIAYEKQGLSIFNCLSQGMKHDHLDPWGEFNCTRFNHLRRNQNAGSQAARLRRNLSSYAPFSLTVCSKCTDVKCTLGCFNQYIHLCGHHPINV